MEQVKLERLLMQEVSGVDDPANQLPGWMVAKSADGVLDPFLLLGSEMEDATKAAASKEPYGDVSYADPGYQKDGKKRYPLDTEAHVRAAWSYINQADNAGEYTSEQLTAIKGKIKAAMKRMGADVAKEAGSGKLAKIKGILLGAPGTEGLDMDRDELVEVLTETNKSLVTAITEAVAVSKSAPTEGAGATEGEQVEPAAAPAEVTPAITAEDVQKTVDEAVEKVREDSTAVFEAVIDRLAAIETHLGVAARKSLDGQEAGAEGTEPVEKTAPDLADAIGQALRRPSRP